MTDVDRTRRWARSAAAHPMSDHDIPHMDDDGVCRCECELCVGENVDEPGCLCADCNVTACGMHGVPGSRSRHLRAAQLPAMSALLVVTYLLVGCGAARWLWRRYDWENYDKPLGMLWPVTALSVLALRLLPAR